MASNFADAVARARADFEAAGVRCVSDPRDVNPPCVLLVMPQIEFQFGKLNADMEWSAYLVAGNSGQPSAAETLGEMLDSIMGVRAFTTGAPYNLPLPGGGDAVPAYLVQWRERSPIGLGE